jgi:hypothetical protein
LPQSSIDELEIEPKEYVKGTFSLAETDGTPENAGPFSAPIEVGIELKGSLGSLRKLSEKAAFKIKFNKFLEGQSFHGLEKMTFNNMVQDPSMIHETTIYQAFHDMGVPAPYAGYTYLTVNGKSYGLHLNIETQDAQSLENAFGTPFTSPPQHLYEGEYAADVSTEPWRTTSEPKWKKLEVSEGKKKEKGDLEALVKRVAEPTPAFGQRMVGYANLDEMTRMWLVEKYAGHWDGYSGQVPDEFHPNNYYLYSSVPGPNSPTGEFQMLPWGTDQTWQHNFESMSFSQGGGILFSDCIKDSTGCLQTYLAAGEGALTKLNALGLDTVARCAAAALQPWRVYEEKESEAEKLPPYTLEEGEDEVAATRTFIANRPAALAAYLNVPAPPKAEGELACPPLRPIAGTGGAGTKSGTPPAPPAPAAGSAARLRLGRVLTYRRSIVVPVEVSGPGRVQLRGEFTRQGRQRAACAGTADVAAAGTRRVVCRLTKAFIADRTGAGRSLRLQVTFTAASGTRETRATKIFAARR